MSDVIYRKYRPKTFDEVIGQDHIVSVLRQQILTDSISHAYLFTGSRGTGKTSVARIFAGQINQISERDSIDIVEIDAASNRGIDDIRDLRDKISYAPSKSGYKIYIIDEVHMLTKEAFNALLKTLEEPPKHVVFILATTEPHKVPITILSRVTRFDFKLADEDSLRKKFIRIFDQENISYEPEVLDELIHYSNGSFRDGESLINKLISFVDRKNKIKIDQVNEVIGLVDVDLIRKFILNLVECNTVELMNLVATIKQSGKNIEIFILQIVSELEKMMFNMLGKSCDIKGSSKIQLSRILEIITELCRASHESKSDIIYGLSLELAVLRLSGRGATSVNKTTSNADTNTSPIRASGRAGTHNKQSAHLNANDDLPQLPEVSTVLDQAGISEDVWKNLVREIAQQHLQLGAVLVNTKLISGINDAIIIEVPYAYYKKKLDSANYKTILIEYLKRVIKAEQISLDIKHNPDLQKKQQNQPDTLEHNNKDIVEDIFNI